MRLNSKDNGKLKVGIIANEFFDAKIGGFGGFGWLARQAAFCLRNGSDQTIETVFLSGNFGQAGEELTSYGSRVLFPNEGWPGYVERLRAEHIDVLLSIDYRPNYDCPIAALPETPLIVWIQDPRPAEDIEKINSLRLPGQHAIIVKGIETIDCTGLSEVVKRADSTGRPITFASPAPQLISKVKGTYGLTLDSSQIHFLPYPLDINTANIEKSPTPRVVFLGRLDPIKRPWIFIALAGLFPHVEFYLLGKSHFEGEGVPSDIPENVRFLGHVDGAEKQSILSSAWILINTSIHEALPVSFLEGLLYEMPIISCQNPEGIVSEFGYYTGRFDGDGLAALPEFAKGLNTLLDDAQHRVRSGKKGRHWVEANHSQINFISILRELCEESSKAGDSRINTSTDEAISSPIPWGIPDAVVNYFQLKEEIGSHFSTNDPFILVDKSSLPVSFPEHKTLAFMEQDGQDWGLPANDSQAISEIETQRRNGAASIVLPWTSFWILDYYKGMCQHLENNYNRIMDNQWLIAFDLSTQRS